jgi:hypothetical protein
MTETNRSTVDITTFLAPHFDPDRWNGWQLSGHDLWYLAHPGTPGHACYTIGLDHCRSAAEVLDAIVMVRRFDWATDACLAGLIHALDDLLNLNLNLCSWGIHRTVTKEHRATRLQRMEERYCEWYLTVAAARDGD